MKTILKFFYSLKFRLFVRFLTYFVFLGYGIYNVITAQTTTQRIIVSLITLLFLLFALYFEYLKHLQRQAIYALNYEIDVLKANRLYDRITALDWFKTFKNERILFDAMANLTCFKADETISLVQQHPKIFKASLDQLLLGNGLLFLAYAYNNQKHKVEQSYSEVTKMKTAKFQGKKVTPIYNYEVLEGIYFLMKNDYKKALDSFSKVNQTMMNPREKAEYYYFFGELAKVTHNHKLLEQQIKLITAINAQCDYIRRLQDESRL